MLAEAASNDDGQPWVPPTNGETPMPKGASNGEYVVRSLCSSVPATGERLWKSAMRDSAIGEWHMPLYDYCPLSATWFYSGPIDADALCKSVEGLLAHLPALAGRRSWPFAIVLSNKGVRFSSCNGYPGSARTHLDDPSYDFCDCQSGTGMVLGFEPLMTVRVTNFVDGTSCIGISMPHSITDGKSFFAIVSALAAGHGHGTFELTPALTLDSAPAMSAAWSRLASRDDHSTLWASCAVRVLVWVLLLPLVAAKVIIHTLVSLFSCGLCFPRMLRAGSSKRAKVHLSLDELRALKVRVASAVGGEITTNEALSAALLKAYHGYVGFKEGTNGLVCMVVNMQGKGVLHDVTNTCGNFSGGVLRPTPIPPATMNIGDAATLFRDLGGDWRDQKRSAALVAANLRAQAWPDPLGGILYWMPYMKHHFPGADICPGAPLFIVNNQSVYPSAQIRFGAGSLLGYTPWFSGPQVHIVAAVEAEQPGASKPPMLRQQSQLKKVVGALTSTTAFNVIDADRSGDISRAELAQALADRAVDCPPEELNLLFAMLKNQADASSIVSGVDQKQFEAAVYSARLSAGVDVYLLANSEADRQWLQGSEFKRALLQAGTGEVKLGGNREGNSAQPVPDANSSPV